MKKVFKLSLGVVGVVTPIASVVSCKLIDKLTKGVIKAKKINDAIKKEVEKITSGDSKIPLVKDSNNQKLIKDWLKKQESYAKGDKDYKDAVDTLEIIKITKANMQDEFINAHITDQDPTGKTKEEQIKLLNDQAKTWMKAVKSNSNKLFLLFKIKSEDSHTYIFTDQGIETTTTK